MKLAEQKNIHESSVFRAELNHLLIGFWRRTKHKHRIIADENRESIKFRTTECFIHKLLLPMNK